jgi:hypothetical protein
MSTELTLKCFMMVMSDLEVEEARDLESGYWRLMVYLIG